MRERRWETAGRLTFRDALAVGERLAALGLKPAQPVKDVICYVEDWAVDSPAEFDRLDQWATEDVTLIHAREGWQGDFFLLAGGYHTVYQQHQSVGTYCSISHPWRTRGPLRFHHPVNMLWLGFRHSHAFIRVRLQTLDVVTPGETREEARRNDWVDERRAIFLDAITTLDLPVETSVEKGGLVLTPADPVTPFFCSWPDAFGPCQFEYNSSDAFEFLVPASRLAATFVPQAASVRAYLTGFSESALEQFAAVQTGARSVYRCSVHCRLSELPEVLRIIEPQGRLYSTLCEFQTQELLPEAEEASAIIGLVGTVGGFQIEARLNRAPLKEEAMAPWLERVIGMSVKYAPLPPFV
ncbi:MAG: hypothetical protein AMXMBFR67_04200 [Nitrospira sp.]|nr:MAG: hypothetical protein DCC63_06015 [Nitrospira sp.]